VTASTVQRYCAAPVFLRPKGGTRRLPRRISLENPEAAPVIERFVKKYGQQPENYSITAYDAALIILDAVKRVAAGGKEVTREAVRDAMQTAHVKTLQGEITFDEMAICGTGRSASSASSRTTNTRPNDVLHQYKYLGVAPQGS